MSSCLCICIYVILLEQIRLGIFSIGKKFSDLKTPYLAPPDKLFYRPKVLMNFMSQIKYENKFKFKMLFMPNNRQTITDKKWLPVVFRTPEISQRRK